MSNPWKMFETLLPASPLEVGEVIAHDNGRSRIALPTGDIITARGTDVAAGHHAYIRDGEVVGEAPAMTVVELDV